MSHVLLILVLLSACSSQEPKTAEPAPGVQMNGFKLSAHEFFKFTAQDITELTKAMRTEGKLSVLQVSDGRNAVCKPGACTLVYEKNNRLELRPADLTPMAMVLKRAQISKKEEKREDGPIILRCTPQHCIYDLLIVDESERQFRDTATLKLQGQEDFFLNPIVQNLIKGAVSTPSP